MDSRERAKLEFLFGEVPVGADLADPATRRALLDELDEDDEFDEFEPGWDHRAALYLTLRAAVVDQILDDQPAGVWRAAARMLDLGLEPDVVMAQLLSAFSRIVQMDMETEGTERSGGLATYEDSLERLPLPGPEAMGTAVVDVVRRLQPVDRAEVVRLVLGRLGLDGEDDGDIAGWNLGSVLDHLTEPGGPLVSLAGERIVHASDLVTEVVLTHRLTDLERDSGYLSLACDLAPYEALEDVGLRLTRDPDALGDPDDPGDPGDPGEGLTMVPVPWGADMAWTGGSMTWLEPYPPGSLLAVRVALEGSVDVHALDDEPAEDPGLAARLRAVYEAEVGETGLPVPAHRLILGLLAADGSTFVEPRPPLADLVAAAGLEVGRWGDVAHDAWVWRNQAHRDRRARILECLDVDEGLCAAADEVLALVVTDGADGAGGAGRAGRASEEELRHALALLFDPTLATEILEALVPADDLTEPDVAEATRFVAGLISAAASPEEITVAHWAAAVVAERRGEVLVADAHLHIATDTGTDWPPALDRAAWYASDRGDATRAARLWRRHPDPSPDELEEIEASARAAAATTPGRNEVCWCGSGRKYKMCHSGAAPPLPLPDRVGWLCRKATAWLARRRGASSLDIWESAYARAVEPDLPDSVLETLSDPIVIDSVLTEGGWFETFIDERGALLPDDEAILARAWTLVARTVYEVTAVEPGAGMTGRDLRTGEHVDVRGRAFSREVQVGARYCARAVPDGAGHQFVGGIFPVPPGAEAALLEICDDGDAYDLCAFVAAMHRDPVPDDVADEGDVVELQAFMERRWLGEPVPALGGLTPRQAAGDPTRREDLARLLDSYGEPSPEQTVRLRPQRLRDLLGLTEGGD